MKILKDKKVIILGGSGLIGKSITKAFLSNGAKVLNLDIKKHLVKNMNYKYIKFDCTNLDDLNSNLNTVIAQNSTPDIFVNASYPRSQDWANNNFKNIKLSSLRHNIEIFLNSSAWCCKYFADKMSLKKKRGGSIVMIGSIYSKVGQNLNIYKGTKMTEKLNNLTEKNRSFLFLCLYANFCEPGVHSYQLYCLQSTSSPILKSLVPVVHFG